MNSYTKILIVKVSKHMSDEQNLFYVHLGMVFFTGIMCAGAPMTFKVTEIPAYLASALGGFGYQICTMKAVRYEKNVGIMAMITSCIVIFGFIEDFFVFGRELNLYNVVGAAILIGSTLFTLIKSKKEAKEEKSAKMPLIEMKILPKDV